jgi:predicted aspartyl protease
MKVLLAFRRRWFFPAALLGAVSFIGLTVVSDVPRDARAATTLGDVTIYSAADDSSPLIESVRDGGALSPIGEMTGAGGEKWFMVKTPTGNVGWIKAGDHAAAKKIDDHFRAMPRDSGLVVQVSSAPESSEKVSTTAAVTVPVKIRGNLVVVPVTFYNGNSSVTGNLVMDTGASQTTVSKRIARDLRLYSFASSHSAGIGGIVPTEISMVEGIKVGSIGLKNMRVSILDFSSDPSFEGLLGFDFLSRFQISVDTEKQVMVLTSRKQ